MINCGPDAGEAIHHLHLHLIGGKRNSPGRPGDCPHVRVAPLCTPRVVRGKYYLFVEREKKGGVLFVWTCMRAAEGGKETLWQK